MSYVINQRLTLKNELGPMFKSCLVKFFDLPRRPQLPSFPLLATVKGGCGRTQQREDVDMMKKIKVCIFNTYSTEPIWNR